MTGQNDSWVTVGHDINGIYQIHDTLSTETTLLRPFSCQSKIMEIDACNPGNKEDAASTYVKPGPACSKIKPNEEGVVKKTPSEINVTITSNIHGLIKDGYTLPVLVPVSLRWVDVLLMKGINIKMDLEKHFLSYQGKEVAANSTVLEYYKTFPKECSVYTLSILARRPPKRVRQSVRVVLETNPVNAALNGERSAPGTRSTNAALKGERPALGTNPANAALNGRRSAPGTSSENAALSGERSAPGTSSENAALNGERSAPGTNPENAALNGERPAPRTNLANAALNGERPAPRTNPANAVLNRERSTNCINPGPSQARSRKRRAPRPGLRNRPTPKQLLIPETNNDTQQQPPQGEPQMPLLTPESNVARRPQRKPRPPASSANGSHAGPSANGPHAGPSANGPHAGLAGPSANGPHAGLAGPSANGPHAGLAGPSANGPHAGLAGPSANGPHAGPSGIRNETGAHARNLPHESHIKTGILKYIQRHISNRDMLDIREELKSLKHHKRYQNLNRLIRFTSGFLQNAFLDNHN